MSSSISILSIDNLPPHKTQEDLQYVSSNRKDHHNSTSTNLAYVIYTSGTTGNPKGVMVEHSNVIRLFTATDNWYKFNQDEVWTLFHSYVFDFSVWEIWGALCYGGKLIVPSYNDTRDLRCFYDLCKKEKVTVLNQTPNAFYQFMDIAIHKVEENNLNKLENLKYVIFGGEALDCSRLKTWFDCYGYNQPKLINMYGITETTVHVTYEEIQERNLCESASIGKRIPDLKTYVLSANIPSTTLFSPILTPLPIGAIGELYIGGAGVARGYLNRPDLTKERFISNPFQTEEEKLDTEYGPNGRNARIYKTGDLVRLLPCGNLEYIGRNDSQVKIRGYRIELGEIEAALRMHPAVKDTIVIFKQGVSDHKMTAYIVPNKVYTTPVFNIITLLKKNDYKSTLMTLPNGLEIFYINKQETLFLYKEIFESKEYIIDDISIEDGDIIVDAGANIGMFTVYAGVYYKNVKIYAFEPIPPIFHILTKNIEAYDLNAECIESALGSKNGIENFTYYPNASVLSGKYANADEEGKTIKRYLLNQDNDDVTSHQIEELLDTRLQQEVFKCQVTTLSKFMKQHKIDSIGLLKIDTEKSELEILDGIESADWAKIRQIIVEVHDSLGSLDYICNFLKSLGYCVSYKQQEDLQNTNLFTVYASRNKSLTTKTQHQMLERYSWNNRNGLISNLEDHLKQFLPHYMIPSYFVLLERLPLTINGKIDRNALPEPECAGDQTSYIAPRNDIEKTLCKIWAKVLTLEEGQIGINDDFFKLGGHSIKLMQLASIVERSKINIPISYMLQNTTIRAMALYVLENSNKIELTETVDDLFYAKNIYKLLDAHSIGSELEVAMPISIDPHKLSLDKLFIIHPGGGLSFPYFFLEKHLNYCVIGINNPHFYKPDEFDSVQQIAEFYLNEITKIQPTGPYNFAGFSFGGCVAYEMSRILYLRTKEPSNVILMDTTVDFENVVGELKEAKYCDDQTINDNINKNMAHFDKLSTKYKYQQNQNNILLIKNQNNTSSLKEQCLNYREVVIKGTHATFLNEDATSLTDTMNGFLLR
ncbi:MAG: amino acid adenylation domain-containing protein [Alphaproteobacteria bacterium]